jgi:hypothetical protein
VFAFASGATALIEASRHVVRAWHQWRLDRRLARNPYILREELSEYQFRIGDDLPPLDSARLVGASLLIGAVAAFPAWLAERHLEQWWQIGSFAFFALTLLVGLWRRFNDPPEMHAKVGTPEITVPREAWLGLVGGLAAVALIVLFIAVLA